MKPIRIVSTFLFFFFLTSNYISGQCTLACFADLNVSLDATGSATLTAADVLANIPSDCGSLILSPNTFSCADIGSAIVYTVTDPVSGNSCFGNINVEDKSPPSIACNSSIVASLPMTGVLDLTPSIILAGAFDNCPLTYTITPNQLTCSDVGTSVVTVSATDPGGNVSTCFTTIDLQATPMTMICLAQLNISLPPSGVATLTPNDILLPPTPPSCALDISVSSVSCADIGTPLTVFVTDTLTGNSCFSTINVEDKFAPVVACNALTNVQLGAGGIVVLNANDILDSSSDNCNLSYSISPSQFDCTDRRRTRSVTVTATDPGNNSASCIGSVFIENPRPDSISINVPASIPCGATGVGFSANVFGGNGPFIYEWAIRGRTNGWSITSGQGTPNITMDVGVRRVRLRLKVTDVCGRSRRFTVRVNCDNAVVNNPGDNPLDSRAQVSNIASSETLKIFPNPALNEISWSCGDDLNDSESLDQDRYQIVNMNGVVVLSGQASSQQVNIQDLPTGVYYFYLIKKDDVMTKRFLKL